MYSLACDTRDLKQWSITTGLQDEPLYDFGQVVDDKGQYLMIDPRFHTAIVGDYSNNLRQIDLSTKVVIKDYGKVGGRACISPDGEYLLVGDLRGQVHH